MVAGRLTLSLLANDLGMGDAGGKRGRADKPTVGHIQAPYPYAVAGRTERPRFRRGFDLRFVAPRGLALETDLHIFDSDPRRDRDTVPLVEPAVHDLVTGRQKWHRRELILAAFGLLHGQDVYVGPLEPVGYPVDAGAARVHVPRGDH